MEFHPSPFSDLTGLRPLEYGDAYYYEANYGEGFAQIAYDYDVPLWNFWAAVQPLPNHGLSSDNFHLTFARSFFDDPVRMRSAWPWRNRTLRVGLLRGEDGTAEEITLACGFGAGSRLAGSRPH